MANTYERHTGSLARNNFTVIGTRKVLYGQRQRIGCWYLAENTRRGHDTDRIVSAVRKCRTQAAVRRRIGRMFKGAPKSLT